ncbi:uncharacterized protein LOC120641069 [Panicum virgatum]|uniref:uncharacterized protein LOC120641069 n=1 Tax=Panicum virgatum TaxID=38727 RepID=UPI0019D52E36|nr:uncharacterized protein LOC120641069 [Panicum virgatum]
MLQTIWVKAEGIPKIAKKETHVMELAYLVGDPEEVFLDSLDWKEVWIKVSCKDPKKIAGTSEVYINKQGHKITWTVAEKGPTKMQKPADVIRNNDDDATDEDEPESQDSYGQLDSDWLKSGTPSPGGKNEYYKENRIYQPDESGKKHYQVVQVMSSEMTVELFDTPSPGGSGKKGSPYLVHSADDTKQMQESEIGQDFIIGLVRHALDTDQRAPPEGSQMKGVQHQPTKASRWSQRAPRTGTPVEALLERRKKDQNLQNTGALWTLWKTRNDLIFNAKIELAPVVVIHKTIALLTHWKILLKKKDQAKMELMIGEMSASALSI